MEIPNDLVTIHQASVEVGETMYTINKWVEKKVLTAYWRLGNEYPKVSLSEVKKVAQWKPLSH